MFEDAIIESKEGIYLNIEVVPNSKNTGIAWDPWRKRIKLKLKAKPQNGKANEEIIKLFGSLCQTKISSGVHSREKTLFMPSDKKIVISFLESLI
ncbi:MAG: DUF167 domain-containing protein [Candidatus Methanofastidiosia archaeon]